MALAAAAAFCSDLGAVNLEINPFALVPPHMDDYDNYTKGYAHASSSDSSSTSAASTPSMMSLTGMFIKMFRLIKFLFCNHLKLILLLYLLSKEW